MPCQVSVIFSTDGTYELQWVRFKNVDGTIETIKITSYKQRGVMMENTVYIDGEGVYGARAMKFTLKFDCSTGKWTISF